MSPARPEGVPALSWIIRGLVAAQVGCVAPAGALVRRADPVAGLDTLSAAASEVLCVGLVVIRPGTVAPVVLLIRRSGLPAWQRWVVD